jgi:hypothetical protein
VQEGTALPSGAVSTVGVLSASEQPVFAGTTQEITLGLERLKSIAWDGSRGVLSGNLDAASSASDAFFYIPANLTLESAKMNASKVKAEAGGQWVSLPLPASGGAFELTFSRK